MKIIKKLKSLILPEVIDFFGELTSQSKLTEEIIEKLVLKYTTAKDNDILILINHAKKSRKEKLKQLETVFITPVDREAISRSYSHLYWIALSVEHLVNELTVYSIYNLEEYKNILQLLQEQIQKLTIAFSLFNKKKYDIILKNINHIIHLDNQLILAYSKQLNELFKQKDTVSVLKHKEALSQLKEISKRIHFCANQIEDIVFKVD